MSPHTLLRGSASPHALQKRSLSPHTLPRGSASPHTLQKGSVSPHTLLMRSLSPHILVRGSLNPHTLLSLDIAVGKSLGSPHTAPYHSLGTIRTLFRGQFFYPLDFPQSLSNCFTSTLVHPKSKTNLKVHDWFRS